MSDLCGYAVVDEDGIEGPCDRPVVGWRWYQDCEHEPMLERACHLHENDGGERVRQIVAERDRARMWAAELEQRLARVAGLIGQFESEIDWSSGRWDYGDNAAWQSAADSIREVLGIE